MTMLGCELPIFVASPAAGAPPVFTRFGIPTHPAGSYRIAAGPDGNMWFTEAYGDNVGRITPQGVITEFRVTAFATYLFGITAGPDGNVWCTNLLGNQIVRITPAGQITQFNVPPA